MSNNRPLVVQSVFLKIIILIIFLKRLLLFIDRNNILNKIQYGFREGLSTLFELLSEPNDKIDEAGDTMSLFHDMTKAFGLLKWMVVMNLHCNGLRLT